MGSKQQDSRMTDWKLDEEDIIGKLCEIFHIARKDIVGVSMYGTEDRCTTVNFMSTDGTVFSFKNNGIDTVN